MVDSKTETFGSLHRTHVSSLYLPHDYPLLCLALPSYILEMESERPQMQSLAPAKKICNIVEPGNLVKVLFIPNLEALLPFQTQLV